MYIGILVFDIANPVIVYYNINMNRNFENKEIYNQILFRHAKGKSLVDGYEIHPYNEILFYKSGGGRLLTERFEEDLTNGTLLIIPKNTYHQISLLNQDNYERFVLNFPDMDMPMFPVSEFQILYPVNNNLMFLIEKMCSALSNRNASETHNILLYGAFLMLLSEISLNSYKTFVPKLRESDELISRCICYIDENFNSDLSAEKIAREMNVSQSTLFKSFKKQMGTPIYKYITEKRLIHAYSLISQNRLPTKVYLECGYNDYATFYKGYTKMFGHPPSVDK